MIAFAALVVSACVAQSAPVFYESAEGDEPDGAFVEITPTASMPPAPVQTSTPPLTAAATTPPPTTQAPEPTPELTPEPTPEYTLTNVKDVSGYVGARSVNLRAGPGREYEVVAEFTINAPLTIKAKTEEWYQVEIGGQMGFMLKEFIGVGSIPTPTPKPTKKPAATPSPTKKPSVSPTARPAETPAAPQPTAAPVEANNAGAGSFSAEDVLLIAQIVYLESDRGSYDGYRAVANVILNRVNSGKFRSTVTGVIFQGNGSQFTPAKNETSLRAVKPSSKCIEAVQAVLNGDTILPSNAYYFRPASKGKSWGDRSYCATYGGNAFFS